MTEITSQFLEKIQNNKRIRQIVAHEHPLWFSMLYLRHHFSHPFAPFHIEMFHLIQQTNHNLVAVMAFRESGKSTIMNMANVLWSILGKPGKKFVIVISKTQEQAKNHFSNIKTELESNELLKEDFGPFSESENDLKKLSLELVYHESKIMSVTPEQGIRGLKYGPHRPDLIICDDMEDISSAFDRKESSSLYERFGKEIIPTGSLGTRVIVLGNLLSDQSLMMRLRDDISKEKIGGMFRVYPLLDDHGKILWQNKFPNSDDIQTLRNKLSEQAWSSEYLLTFDSVSNPKELPSVMPDPLDQKKYLDAVGLHCDFKWVQVENKYRNLLSDIKPQKHLIPQMESFKISAPAQWFFEPRWPGDPLYEIYKEYEGERRKIEMEFIEGLKTTIRAQVMADAIRKGDIPSH